MKDNILRLLYEALLEARKLQPSMNKEDIVSCIQMTYLDVKGWIDIDKDTEYKKESGR